MLRGRGRRGMTLIEIVVVIAILTMLMSAVGVYAVGQLEPARRKAARMDVRNLGTALDAYYAIRGRYPTAAEGLAWGPMACQAEARPART